MQVYFLLSMIELTFCVIRDREPGGAGTARADCREVEIMELLESERTTTR